MTEFVCEWERVWWTTPASFPGTSTLECRNGIFSHVSDQVCMQEEFWGFARTPPFGLQMILYTAYLFILNTIIILFLRKLKKIIMLWPYIRLDLS